MNIISQISNDTSLWEEKLDLISDDYIEKITKIILEELNFKKDITNVEISILLTSDLNIKSLNQQYRNKNAATNVLSFPSEDLLEIELCDFPHYQGHAVLGDIVFAYETCISEAEQENIDFIDKFSHLLVHSILHLLGYDHEDDEDAKKMEDMEDIILSKIGIKVNREG
jgi:probable rRNA maturation factor